MYRLFLVAACAASLFAQVPKVTGPLPVTPTSHPFLAASQNLTPLDLSKFGYVEEEYLVSGTANVYDWTADGKLSIKTPNAAYTTRILVRRPVDPSKFSGTAIVELPNMARRFDWTMMWGFSQDYFMEHGDAWVAVTLAGSVDGLKKFNPTRYAELSYTNPNPGQTCGANGAPAMEDGLKWDMLSQVANVLKAGPAGIRAQRVFMTSQSTDLETYINAIQETSKAYDGFLLKGIGAPSRINGCAPQLAKGDSRIPVKDVNVPVIAVVAQGEAVDMRPYARPDSDTAKGGFRLYELAGATHIDKHPYTALPSIADQNAAGAAQGTADWPFTARCEPEIQMSALPLLQYSFNAAFANLDAWSRKGTPAPKAQRLNITDGAIARDQAGNGLGGVRSVYVDVPTVTMFTTTPGPGTCRELGYEVPFSWQRLESMYGTSANYATKVNQSVDQLVKDRWLTESDAKKIRASLVTPPASLRATSSPTK